MSTTSVVPLRDLTFEWPDGTVALDCVSGTFTAAPDSSAATAPASPPRHG